MADLPYPAEAFHPGEFLRDELEARGWTQTDLAEILGRPPRLVNEIIAGKRGISPETARGLAEALGTTPQLWLNLDAAWELSRTGPTDPGVALRARLYTRAPIKEMTRRGWIEGSPDPEVLERRVLDFLQIRDLDQEPTAWAHAARSSTAELTALQLAWLCRARQLAPTVPVSGPFEPTSPREAAIALRALAEQAEDAALVPATLARHGIRLVVIEPIPASKLDGATFWLDAQSPVIALSMRYDRIDYFWHTLMHELGHIASGDGTTATRPSVDIDTASAPGDATETPQQEQNADRFATSTLVPAQAMEEFIQQASGTYSIEGVTEFAARLAVHPGIVVGQLQHRGLITYAQMRKALVKVRASLIETALTDGWGHTPAAG